MADRLSRDEAMLEALRLLAAHDGQWTWYQLDRAFDVSRLPDGYRLNVLMEDLVRAGWIVAVEQGADRPRLLHLTVDGRARVDSR